MKYLAILLLLASCSTIKTANDIASELCSVILSSQLPKDQADALCLIPEILKPFLTKGNPEDQKQEALGTAKKMGKIQ